MSVMYFYVSLLHLLNRIILSTLLQVLESWTLEGRQYKYNTNFWLQFEAVSFFYPLGLQLEVLAQLNFKYEIII